MKSLLTMRNPIHYENILSTDIETSSQGKILDIGVYHESQKRQQYQVFTSWNYFFQYLISFPGKNRVIAHNGFGFDFITFNQWFLKNRLNYGITDDDVVYLSSEALIMGLIIYHNGNQYTFIDTTRYFPGQTLQKLAESFLSESKDDVPDDYISRMEVYKRKYKTKYYAYLKKDCKLLFDIYCKFRNEINAFADIGELGMSAGSTALKTFRRWLHTDYPRTRIFSAPSEYQNLADNALRGGLTLYIGDGKHDQHKYEKVYHYDVVSMYPSIMRYVPTPSSPMIYTNKLVKDFDTYRPGWYLCNYEQVKGRIPILFTIDSEYPEWKGQGIFSHFEIQFLEKYGTFEVLDGVVYDDYIFPFEEFFDRLSALRLYAKKNGQSAKSHALKILANALYGKFGQKPTREIISITSNKDWYESLLEARLRDYNDSGITEYVVSDDYVLYGIEQASTAFSNRFIGAMVTALARLKLGMILNTLPAIYCDTDSIFSQEQLSNYFIGNEIGFFEESDDSPSTMICLGKKSYMYGNDIKFKGVPNKNITLNDIQSMRYEFETIIEYKSPTAWRTAMKNQIENPNKFLPRSRRVKRGKSLCELKKLHQNAKLFSAKDVKEFLDQLLSL